MIISCIKCNKKFEINDSLIPAQGRLLQCGSCQNTWHYHPPRKKDSNEKNYLEEISQIKIEKKKSKNKNILKKIDPSINYNEEKTRKKNIGFVSILLIFIITLATFVIVVDTFEDLISIYYPDVTIYLENLYETINDVFLFLENLII